MEGELQGPQPGCSLPPSPPFTGQILTTRQYLVHKTVKTLVLTALPLGRSPGQVSRQLYRSKFTAMLEEHVLLQKHARGTSYVA